MKRLKEVTVKHILENFQKLGKLSDRATERSSTGIISEDGSDLDFSDRSLSRSGSSLDYVVSVDKM